MRLAGWTAASSGCTAPAKVSSAKGPGSPCTRQGWANAELASSADKTAVKLR